MADRNLNGRFLKEKSLEHLKTLKESPNPLILEPVQLMIAVVGDQMEDAVQERILRLPPRQVVRILRENLTPEDLEGTPSEAANRIAEGLGVDETLAGTLKSAPEPSL